MSDRDQAFARAALAAHLVSRQHAEECLRVANDLARRGKPLAVEEVLVRKGYLGRAQAQKLARTLASSAAPAKKVAKPASKLELAPNVGATPDYSKKGRRCPSCDRDPGRAEDYCPRCGADLETGGPGPDATMCPSCARVVKKGSAVCPRCALPIERARLGHRGTGSGWLDRLVVLAAVTGCFYFLVYRNVIAPAPAADTAEGDAKTPAERVQEALANADAAAAARALEEAIKEEGHDPALEPAFALACLRAGRNEDARGAIFAARERRPEDVDLMLVSAEIAAATSDLDAARRTLALVPKDRHDDAYARARARVATSAKDHSELAKALRDLKAPTPAETRSMAELAVERAQALLDDLARDLEKKPDERKLDEARKELEQAIQWAPRWSLARERLGVVYLRWDKPGQAGAQFQWALDLDGTNVAAHLGLAIALDKRHDKRDQIPPALDHYRAFLRLAKEEDHASEIKMVRGRIVALEKLLK